MKGRGLSRRPPGFRIAEVSRPHLSRVLLILLIGAPILLYFLMFVRDMSLIGKNGWSGT